MATPSYAHSSFAGLLVDHAAAVMRLCFGSQHDDNLQTDQGSWLLCFSIITMGHTHSNVLHAGA